jgi:hypothetical protein
VYIYIYTILESSVTLRHSTHVAIYLYLDPFFRSLQGFLDSKDNLLVGQGTRILIHWLCEVDQLKAQCCPKMHVITPSQYWRVTTRFKKKNNRPRVSRVWWVWVWLWTHGISWTKPWCSIRLCLLPIAPISVEVCPRHNFVHQLLFALGTAAGHGPRHERRQRSSLWTAPLQSQARHRALLCLPNIFQQFPTYSHFITFLQ